MDSGHSGEINCYNFFWKPFFWSYKKHVEIKKILKIKIKSQMFFLLLNLLKIIESFGNSLFDLYFSDFRDHPISWISSQPLKISPLGCIHSIFSFA